MDRTKPNKNKNWGKSKEQQITKKSSMKVPTTWKTFLIENNKEKIKLFHKRKCTNNFSTATLKSKVSLYCFILKEKENIFQKLKLIELNVNKINKKSMA